MKNVLAKHRGHCKTVIQKITEGSLYTPDLSIFLKDLPEGTKVNLLGAGKAGLQMAMLAEKELGSRLKDGIIITTQKSNKLDRVQVFEGAHPYPDYGSVSSSYELMQFASKIPKDESVVFLLSGGASSLLCIPAGKIELDELRTTYKLLLGCGAGIDEINTVRKHLSETGGGRIGKLLAEHELVTIAISDVPGNSAEVIGSAPTIADPTTYKEAFQVLKHHTLWEEVPHSVRVHLTRGMQGDISETVKPEETDWKKHHVHVIPGAEMLAKKVGNYFKEEGFNTRVANKAYDEEITQLSKRITKDTLKVQGGKSKLKTPAALVYFGESSVEVKGNGKGGRNQELALRLALSIEGQHPITVLSFATDGKDGPTDSAGALINSGTYSGAKELGIDAKEFLKRNDSYHFHQKMNTAIRTGETGLNYMDLQIILIG